ncbi:hypothetical protein CcaverHIS641_0400530 [Cutaneotrichosporon cavernicola]|nr:hypothetical protein CcaverHIS641_0400530 [Cutaneotrichosporon cavernicola]
MLTPLFLLAVVAAQTMPTANEIPALPIVPVSLPFDMVFAAHSPLLRFGESTAQGEDWHMIVPGRFPLPNETLSTPVTYQFGPAPAFDSEFYAPLLGTGVLLTGNTSPDYDGWCRAVAGLAENGITGIGPLVDANYGGFTRTAVVLWRGDTGGNGTVDIASMTVRTGMNSTAPSLVEVPTSHVPFVVDGQANPDFQYVGNWTVSPSLPDGTPHATLVSGPGNSSIPPTLKMTVPRGTAFLIVNGTARAGAGALAVAWNIVPAYVLEATGTYSYPPSNAGNAFIAPGEVYYYAALDPAVAYDLTLGPYGQTEAFVDLVSVTFYSSSQEAKFPFTTKTLADFPGSYDTRGNAVRGDAVPGDAVVQPQRRQVGPIVGGIIGAVFVLAVVGGVVWWRRRRAIPPRLHIDAETPPPSPSEVVEPPLVTPWEGESSQSGFPRTEKLPGAALSPANTTKPFAVEPVTPSLSDELELTSYALLQGIATC